MKHLVSETGRTLLQVLNRCLAALGLRLIRYDPIAAKGDGPRIVANAREEGLSVCDYLEQKWGQVGLTKRIIQLISQHCLTDVDQPVICELGAGTGRYTEQLLEVAEPSKYVIYEPNDFWSQRLEELYPVVCAPADRVSLSETQSHTVDLLHAHGVFVYTPVIVSLANFRECCRVVKPGGFVVFDIISENTLMKADVDKWLEDELYYPSFLSRTFVVNWFLERGFELVTSHLKDYGSGRSEYLFFRKKAPAKNLKLAADA